MELRGLVKQDCYFSLFPSFSLAHNHSSAQKASMERGTSKPLQAQHMLVLTNKACELGPVSWYVTPTGHHAAFEQQAEQRQLWKQGEKSYARLAGD